MSNQDLKEAQRWLRRAEQHLTEAEAFSSADKSLQKRVQTIKETVTKEQA
jgi:cell division GTPase FtsZ